MADNTNPWTALFGSVKLSNHNGEPVDPTSFSSKSGVMIYFSAHWCPPCRGFTPQLAEYYKTHKDKHNFEIVFVSSDKDQSAFDGYWAEMPWLALPYANRDTKTALSAKYKVQGIPTLVVLDNNGKTITTGGRGKVTSDPEGFPWIPKTFSQIIKGDVLNLQGEKISTDTLSSKTALGVYFSAHWCPPCRGFTPKLVETYKKIKAAGKNFEIVFASSDNDEASFKEYFHEMPWLALPYGDKRISELSDLYDVEGIPHLVILDPSTGQIINPNGRSVVEADPEGNEFPWHPKPLNSVETAGGVLNDSACLIYIDSNLNEDTKGALNTVATHFFDKWKAEKKDEHPLLFFHGNGAGLSQRVKDFTNLSSVNPLLLILNIPGECKHVATLSGAPSEADFRTFVESFLAGSLAKKGIKE